MPKPGQDLTFSARVIHCMTMKIHQSFSLLTLGLTFVLFFCTGRALAQNVPEVVPHVVVVQFEDGIYFPGKTSTTGLQVFDRKAAAYGVHTIERMYPFLDRVEPTPKTRNNLLALRRSYYVRYSADVVPERVAKDLAFAPGVIYAEPIPVNRTSGPVHWEYIDPNDPGFNLQTELQAMKLPNAWNVVRGSDRTPKVVIAIVDGGGEWRHEDLRANVWTNTNEIPGNGIDDDNNGFIDDVHGINLANRDDTNNDPTGMPETPGNARHGTAVAGSASAVTNNNTGVAGAAWNAELMHINAGCGRAELDDIICFGYTGVLYAAINGADIINASWGSLVAEDQRLRNIDQVLDLVTDMGALVVAAAGNRNYSIDVFRDYPPRHPRVLSVGATEKETRVKAGFSNYGKLVNVFAPGVRIITTGSGNRYVRINGTSFSSPLTAGVAALVKTRFPNLSPDELREQVRLASKSIDDDNPEVAGQLGRGFVDALAAVRRPTVPAIRLSHWSWEDNDGDRIIEPGDRVTITMTVANHLVDANQLRVGLVGAEPYSFVRWTTSEVEVGRLDNGDSAEVVFEFTVAPDAPANERVRFFTHVHEGAFEDVADMISLRVNQQLELVHQGLSALYTATDGDNWVKNDNWDITTVPSEQELVDWFGVSLSEGLVVELSMGNNNLRGTLPPELENLRNLRILGLFENEGLSGPVPPELGNLERLQRLILRDNSLTGSIPSELGNLEQLQALSLRGNSLTGLIPPELGNLEQLQGVSFSSNSLSGPIPPEFGSLKQLQELWLQNNSLSGEIPSELGNLEQLRILSLADNSFTGSIPSEFGNLERLWILSLAGNSLSGEIPSELGHLDQLQTLILQNNSLSGTIPAELGNLEQLQVLGLRGNSLSGPIPRELGGLEQLQRLSLSGNSLSGSIPSELKNLKRLEGLWLWDNSLTGSIPPELGNLEQLQTLWMHRNSLSGLIPPELGILKQLEDLDLSGNSLAGPIPRELGNLQQLQRLWLSDNSLFGEIPPELGNLDNLKDLRLESDSLSGPIPSTLGDLAQLEALWLSNNSLSGEIPPELGNLGQLKDLRLENNSVSGSIPSEFGNLKQLEDLNLSNNSLSGPIPPELGNLSRLRRLNLEGNVVKGRLPRSLMKLDSLEVFDFGGQNLCAPGDDEFQTWLNSIPSYSGPTCIALHFADDIADQSYPRTQPITPLILPEAMGGISPITYVITPISLPWGLMYDPSTRTISGTPTVVTSSPMPFTFKAIDFIGVTDSLVFTIEVFSPVSSQQEELPESFTVQGNYPNPFRESTRLVVDLPWPATLNVEVFDVMGRRVLSPPPVDLVAGWSQNILIEGSALPSGLYVYRIQAESPVGIRRLAGRFLRVR